MAEGTVNFLRVADPTAALRIVAEKIDPSVRSNWLGSLYAFAGLGVNAVAPDSGEPIATKSPKLSSDGLAASFRSAMLESADLKLILSGVATTAALAHDLVVRNALPEGYAEYCCALMRHARELYPQTSLDCSPLSPGAMVGAPLTPRIGSERGSRKSTLECGPYLSEGSKAPASARHGRFRRADRRRRARSRA